MQTGRDKCIRIALLQEEAPVIVSPAYSVLEVNDLNSVLPEYIMLWFSRAESDRHGWFASDGRLEQVLTCLHSTKQRCRYRKCLFKRP